MVNRDVAAERRRVAKGMLGVVVGGHDIDAAVLIEGRDRHSVEGRYDA